MKLCAQDQPPIKHITSSVGNLSGHTGDVIATCISPRKSIIFSADTKFRTEAIHRKISRSAGGKWSDRDH